MTKRIGVSTTVLKLFACIAMTVDHAAILLWDSPYWMRCIGRLAFPIFAFLIAEGCRYTKHHGRYFLQIAVLGVICEAVYMLAGNRYYGNILIAFSLSILLIYLWQQVQRCLAEKSRNVMLWVLLFLAVAVGVWLLIDTHGIDYGFAGVMTPVMISFAHNRYSPPSRWYSFPTRIALFAVALLWASITNPFPIRQLWSLLCMPLMLLYDGTAGKTRWKYGFYLFYPLHLVILQGLALI